MSERNDPIADFQECQLPCLPRFAEGDADVGHQPVLKSLKRTFAKPWNYFLKKWLKRYTRFISNQNSKNARMAGVSVAPITSTQTYTLKAGDLVRVRSRAEIEATLDRWKELKGCAFLEYMWQYCDTTQRVLQSMERFLDERDYKVKKVRGLVLLEGVICRGTPVFGRCDRCCHLFWREEWLEKIGETST